MPGKADKSKLIRLTVLVLLFAGAVSATVGCAVHYASARASARAFAVAPACNPGQTDTSDCVLNLTARVDRFWSTKDERNSTDYFLTISGPDPANGYFQLPGPDAFYPPPQQGDTVNAFVWRGRVVEILGDADSGFDTDYAPGLQTGRAFDWLLAAILWCLALASLPLYLVSRLSTSLWRNATVLAVLAAVMFTCGAAVGNLPFAPAYAGPLAGAVGSVFFGAIFALAARYGGRGSRLR